VFVAGFLGFFEEQPTTDTSASFTPAWMELPPYPTLLGT
jgi:hypothetical protein